MPEAVDFGPIRHRAFATADAPLGTDAVSSRIPLLANRDVILGVARPSKSMDYFYRNAQAYETWWVHEGSGVLKSQFGNLPFHKGDYIVIPFGTTWQMHIDGDEARFFTIENPSQIEPPKRYRNHFGQLLKHAPYWLGGMLTNFVTIKKRIGLLEQLEARQGSGEFERLPKKEAAKLTEEPERLQAMLGGIRRMKRLPGAVFIVDPHRERIAVTEANKLEIPVVGTGDTNVDPDELDFIIPANDDAIRSIRLLCSLVADAAIEGTRERAARATMEPETEPMAPDPEYDDVGASDALVAALAGGAALSFAPDEEEDLLLGSLRSSPRFLS